jgi:hypothetical protein
MIASVKILDYYRMAFRRSRLARIAGVIGGILAVWVGLLVGFYEGVFWGALAAIGVWIALSALVVAIKWVLMPNRH